MLELKNGFRYYGSTTNLEQRLQQHQKGSVIATRGKFKSLVFAHKFATIKEAQVYEQKFKKSKNKTYNASLMASLGKSAPT
ncbi:MAG: GIY-YIG nuclease family protein [Candidatus Peribacteria bacterium]|nr:MAG: GIY-YIG nuclease family protein [Candidatus Peribacteria bacterium]